MPSKQEEARRLVSVVINNYNYGKYLDDAVTSALRQTYQSVEVIVVDDGSTDDSIEVIERFGTRVIPLFKSNGGQASAFNAGFQVSAGDIICFLDADDIFHPTKVAQVVRSLDSHPEAGWYFHELKRLTSAVLDDERTVYETTPVVAGTHEDTVTDLRADARAGRLPYFPTATSGMCFRRELLSQILPMPAPLENKGRRITSDNYLKYVAAATSPGIMSRSQVAILRLHGANAYTGQPAHTAQRGTLVMRLAYWLLREHPELHRLADREFAFGRRLYMASARDPEAELAVSDYLNLLPFGRRLFVAIRSSSFAAAADRLIKRRKTSIAD